MVIRLYELEGKYGAKTRELEETVLGLRQDIVQNTKAFKVGCYTS